MNSNPMIHGMNIGNSELERMRQLMARLGDPQESLRVVHVAGTSGKGSTSYLLSIVLRACGHEVGLYMSPYVVNEQESIQVNGQSISAADLRRLRLVVASWHPQASVFETDTAVAFLYFVERRLDYVIIETGMGGSFDATNVVARPDKLSIITRIGLDHTEFLGRSISEIARHKAGIITSGNQCLVLQQDGDVLQVMERRAEETGATVRIVDPTPRIQSHLIGVHQRENEALALNALEYLSTRDGWSISWKAIAAAFDAAYLPGRMDVRHMNNRILVLDGAHNPQKMETLVRALRSTYPTRRLHFVVSFKQGKDWAGMLTSILPEAASITVTEFRPQLRHTLIQSVTATEVMMAIPDGCEAVAEPDVAQSLSLALVRAAECDVVVVTGSFYFLTEVYTYLGVDPSST